MTRTASMRTVIVGTITLCGSLPLYAADMPWAASYNHARSTAKDTGKLMMIDFYTDW